MLRPIICSIFDARRESKVLSDEFNDNKVKACQIVALLQMPFEIHHTFLQQLHPI